MTENPHDDNATWWNPAKGEFLSGTITKIFNLKSSKNDATRPVLRLALPDDTIMLVTTWHNGLFNPLKRARPGVNDRVDIRYDGLKDDNAEPGKDNPHRYTVAVNGAIVSGNLEYDWGN